MSIDEMIKDILKVLVIDLVNGNYNDLIKDGRIVRLTEDEIKNVITSYRGQLTLPPEDAYDLVEIYQVNNSNQYAVDFDLWIDNQRSDLTLSITVCLDNNTENVSITIDNLHVL